VVFKSALKTKTICRPLIVSFTLSVVSAVTIFTLIVVNPHLINWSDFVSLQTGAVIIKKGEAKSLYDVSLQAKIQNESINESTIRLLPFRMLPPAAFFLSPLSFLGLVSAYRVFAAFNLLGLFFSVYQIKKLLRWHGLLPYLIAFSYWPVVSTIFKGQISIFILILFTFLFIFINKKRPFSVGVIASLLFNKPQFLLMIPFLFGLVENKLKFLYGFLLSSVCLFFLGVLLVGFDTMLRYPVFLYITENPVYGSYMERYSSIFPLFLVIKERFFLFDTFPFLANTFFYLTSVVYFWIRKGKSSPMLSFSVGIVFTLLFGIHIWEHDFSILLLVVFFMAYYWKKTRNLTYLFVFSFLYLLPFLQYLVYQSTIPLGLFTVGLFMLSSRMQHTFNKVS